MHNLFFQDSISACFSRCFARWMRTDFTGLSINITSARFKSAIKDIMRFYHEFPILRDQ